MSEKANSTNPTECIECICYEICANECEFGDEYCEITLRKIRKLNPRRNPKCNELRKDAKTNLNIVPLQAKKAAKRKAAKPAARRKKQSA